MWKKCLLAFVLFITGLLLTTTVLLMTPLPIPPNLGQDGVFLIRGVTVVDVENGDLQSKQHVLLRDGMITSVSAERPDLSHPSLQVIDGSGKYLMPALWDMHTHSSKLSPQYEHPLWLAHGVSAVREMWGCMSEPEPFFACKDDRDGWNQALADGSGISPRYLLHSSFQVNGGNEVPEGYPEFFKARDEDEARQLVAFYAEAGADFIKTYTELSLPAYQALAAEAREQGLYLAGHRPLGVSMEDLLAAGQRSVEHGRLLFLECYRDAEEFRDLSDPLAAYTPELKTLLVDRQDNRRCAELIKALASSDTWWVPTLQTLQMSAMAADPAFRNDPRLMYVPYLIRRVMWMPDADRAAAQIAAHPHRNVEQELFLLSLRQVGAAHDSGAKLMTGTDSGDTYVVPGFSVHEELVLLVEAGLSPADAIKSATLDAAEFSGLEAQYGSVEENKTADLLLLNGNPLAEIQNTQQIDGLFYNGRYYDRSALDELLAFAAKQAGSLKTNLHLAWMALKSPLMRVQFAD